MDACETLFAGFSSLFFLIYFHILLHIADVGVGNMEIKVFLFNPVPLWFVICVSPLFHGLRNSSTAQFGLD